MIKNKTYSALVLLLLMPLATIATQETADSDVASDPLEQTVPVADEQVLTEPAAGTGTEEQLMEEFARYRRLLMDGTLDEADIAAKRIVEMAIRLYGPQSRETASALNNLGIVQHGNGQFDAAIQNFTSSIEIIEVVEDRLNDALVNPLKGLGAAQLGNGRPDQANKTFNRAAHITHVNEGPHNLDQVEILESIAETHIRMGDTKRARDMLDRIHVINVKHFEKDPLGLLPSLMNRAAWQHRAGYFAEERSSYRRAIRIVETSSGKNDPMLIEPLRRLGESFYYVDMSVSATQQYGMISSGEMYFKRAARIAEKSKDVGWRDLTMTQIALADYFTYTESHSRARRIYREIWQSLDEDEERIALRDELFRDPVPIREDSLPVFAGGIAGDRSSRNDLVAGRIIVDYTVSTRGRVRELRTESIPPEFTDMQRMVHREVRRRVYRPRVVDGDTVEAENARFEHAFSYLQSDLDTLREAQPSPSSNAEEKGQTDDEQQRSDSD